VVAAASAVGFAVVAAASALVFAVVGVNHVGVKVDGVTLDDDIHSRMLLL
jgi:hypothetical protein